MSEKIYGEFENQSDINELAINLRSTKEHEEIRQLAVENNIGTENTEAFINGDRINLVDPELENNEPIDGQTDEKIIETENIETPINEDTVLVNPDLENYTLIVEQESIHYTMNNVRDKLEKELTIYKDGDSKYTVEKILELCETNKMLLDNIMQPHKSYDKAFQYFYEKSRAVGYKMPHGDMVYLDNDKAVELSVEYFNRDDAAEEAKKAEERKKREVEQKKTAEHRKASEKAKKNKSKITVSKSKNQVTSKSKTPTAPAKVDIKKQETDKHKKKTFEGQLSLFDF